MDLTLAFVKLWKTGIHKLQHALVNNVKSFCRAFCGEFCSNFVCIYELPVMGGVVFEQKCPFVVVGYLVTWWLLISPSLFNGLKI